MTNRESQLENRLIGAERQLEYYRQEILRLRQLVEQILQAQGQIAQAKYNNT